MFVTMQADDSDIERLAELFASKRVKTETEDTELKADIWQEEGPWLLLLVIPLVALWPRRGWLLCTLLFVLPVPQPVHADESGGIWPLDSENLWQRPDQRGMQAFNAGDADQAAELFQDESWKAAAYYRAGEYDKSNALLDQPSNATDYYNKGNVLARLGNYPDAIEAYDRALSMDPDNEDARFNRELVKKALEQQQSQQEQQSDDSSEQQQDQSQQQSQDASQQQQDQQPSDQQQQDQESDEQQQNAEQKQDQLSDIKERNEQQQQDSDKQQQQQPEAQQADEEQQAEDQQPLEAQQQDEAYEQEDAETVESEQAMEQWLRRIPDDPGGLMRRKFIYQYRQMPNQAEAQEPW